MYESASYDSSVYVAHSAPVSKTAWSTLSPLRKTYLLHLPLIPLVGAGYIVGQSFWAGEVVVAAGRGDDVALAGDLAGEAGDGAGDLVDLAEEENTWETAMMVLGSHYVLQRKCKDFVSVKGGGLSLTR